MAKLRRSRGILNLFLLPFAEVCGSSFTFHPRRQIFRISYHAHHTGTRVYRIPYVSVCAAVNNSDSALSGSLTTVADLYAEAFRNWRRS